MNERQVIQIIGPFLVTFLIDEKSISVYDGTGNYDTSLVVGAMLKAGKITIENIKVGKDNNEKSDLNSSSPGPRGSLGCLP